MHGFVVRTVLRQHVPLRTYVENPQYRFQHTTRGNRLTASSTVRDVLFRKMVGCVSTDRPSVESSHIYKRSTPVSNFEIASSQARACARRGCPCRRATTARAEPINDRENKIALPCRDRTCWCVRHYCRHWRNYRRLNGKLLKAS
jgi:hypothetical protein